MSDFREEDVFQNLWDKADGDEFTSIVLRKPHLLFLRDRLSSRGFCFLIYSVRGSAIRMVDEDSWITFSDVSMHFRFEKSSRCRIRRLFGIAPLLQDARLALFLRVFSMYFSANNFPYLAIKRGLFEWLQLSRIENCHPTLQLIIRLSARIVVNTCQYILSLGKPSIGNGEEELLSSLGSQTGHCGLSFIVQNFNLGVWFVHSPEVIPVKHLVSESPVINKINRPVRLQIGGEIAGTFARGSECLKKCWTVVSLKQRAIALLLSQYRGLLYEFKSVDFELDQHPKELSYKHPDKAM
ncbi:hypothetical protein Tco_0593729 [Tanacetum coccineum]